MDSSGFKTVSNQITPKGLDRPFFNLYNLRMTDKCETCGQTYSPSCDWRQGRCPHHPSMFDQIMSDTYKTRYYNLLQTIKGLFK